MRPIGPIRPIVPEGFTPPHGGYEDLLSFQKARIVFDGTVRFCDRFVDKRSRTRDQMVQAARSGKQNILEGSQASGTSKETELKLTNVARASLEELLEDYRDFLRTGGHALWDKNSKEALYVRKLGRKSNTSYETYRTYFETRPPEIVANILICLIHQTNYLLDQQLRRLEQDFLAEGGLRERMTRARLTARGPPPAIGPIRPISPIEDRLPTPQTTPRKSRSHPRDSAAADSRRGVLIVVVIGNREANHRRVVRLLKKIHRNAAADRREVAPARGPLPS